MDSISVVMITKNEAAHVRRALTSVRTLADEIIVIDSESTDETVAIAETIADTVLVRPWGGYGAMKNMGKDVATKNWILQIDADEEVSTALATEIRTLLANPTVDFYWFPIVTEFLGKPLSHLRGTNLRLFRRVAGRWDDRAVHEQVERTPGATLVKKRQHDPHMERHSRAQPFEASTVHLHDPDTLLLHEPLLHHGHYQTLAGYKARQEKYTTADALHMIHTGIDRSGRLIRVNTKNPFSLLPFLFWRGIKQFIRKWILRGGILDGWQGWVWCYVSAEYEVKVQWKYLRKRQTEKSV